MTNVCSDPQAQNRPVRSAFAVYAALGLILTLIALCIPTQAAHAELPDLGDSVSGMVSTEQEYDIGRAWLRSLRRQLPVLDDPLIQDYVRDLAYRLVPNSELTDRRLQIVIIDSSALNAFAVPGGIIGVNGGLFLNAHTEEEFASVLAHEIAHLSQRHFARRMERAQRNQPLALAGMLASIVVAAAAGGDAGMAALATTQAYNIQQQLNYSRENEQEADRIGLTTLARSGMDPRAMAAMFERMMRNNRYGQQVPEYLRTHPLNESRVADARNRAESYPRQQAREDIEYYFMKNRLLVHYAESADAARHRFEDMIKQEKGLQQKAAHYGLAIAAIKAGRFTEAENALKPLLEAYPNRISVLLAQAELLTAQGKHEDSEALLAKHYGRNPGNQALGRAYAQSLVKLGRDHAAEPVLQQLLQTYDNDPSLWRALAEVQGRLGNIAAVHQAQAEYLFLTDDIDGAIAQLHHTIKRSQGNFRLSALAEKRLQDFHTAKEGIRF